MLVLIWVNDEDSKRAYEAGTDAYRVFRKMVERGYPPSDWDQLPSETKPEVDRMERIARASE